MRKKRHEATKQKEERSTGKNEENETKNVDVLLIFAWCTFRWLCVDGRDHIRDNITVDG